MIRLAEFRDLPDVHKSVVIVIAAGAWPSSPCESGEDSEDSTISVRNSEASDSVSQEAIGASFGLGGINKLVGCGSVLPPPLDVLLRSVESCLSSANTNIARLYTTQAFLTINET